MLLVTETVMRPSPTPFGIDADQPLVHGVEQVVGWDVLVISDRLLGRGLGLGLGLGVIGSSPGQWTEHHEKAGRDGETIEIVDRRMESTFLVGKPETVGLVLGFRVGLPRAGAREFSELGLRISFRDATRSITCGETSRSSGLD